MALLAAASGQQAAGFEMWGQQDLAAPFHPDVLDDLMPEAMEISSCFQLAEGFHKRSRKNGKGR